MKEKGESWAADQSGNSGESSCKRKKDSKVIFKSTGRVNFPSCLSPSGSW